LQIRANAMIPYGMPSHPATLSPVGGRTRAIESVAPVIHDSSSGAGWIDADWMDAPSRPARIDPYDDYAKDAGAVFLALQEAQTATAAPNDPAQPVTAQIRAAAAYRLQQGTEILLPRGALGIDLRA
jgi:hypothetical protein